MRYSSSPATQRVDASRGNSDWNDWVETDGFSSADEGAGRYAVSRTPLEAEYDRVFEAHRLAVKHGNKNTAAKIKGHLDQLWGQLTAPPVVTPSTPTPTPNNPPVGVLPPLVVSPIEPVLEPVVNPAVVETPVITGPPPPVVAPSVTPTPTPAPTPRKRQNTHGLRIDSTGTNPIPVRVSPRTKSVTETKPRLVTCKPRPKDNRPSGSGGGGSFKKFVPWCK